MGLFFLIFGVTLTLLGVTFLSVTFFCCAATGWARGALQCFDGGHAHRYGEPVHGI